jgi:cell division protein FtsN
MARPSQAPVDLPMRSYGKIIAIAAAVLVAFVAIAVSIVATGISSTISLPHSAAEPAAPTQPARVGVVTRAAEATTESTAVTQLPAAGFGAGAVKPVTPGAPRRSDIVPVR